MRRSRSHTAMPVRRTMTSGLRRAATVLAAAALALTGATSAAQAASAGNSQRLAMPAAHALNLTMADPSAPDVPSPVDPQGLVQAAEAEVSAYNGKAATLQKQADALVTEKQGLDTRTSALTAQADQLTAAETTLASDASSLNTQIDALNAQIDAHNARAGSVDTTSAAAVAAYNAEKAQLDGQQAQLRSQQQALQARQSQLDQQATQIQTAQQRLDTDDQAYNDQVASVETQAQELDTERQQVLQDITTMEQQALDAVAAIQNAMATAGADASAPATGPAQTLAQAQGPASSGGDAPYQAQAAYQTAPSDAGGSALADAAPAPAIAPGPVTATLSPDTVSGLTPSQTAHLNPRTAFNGLIPEPNGNYAAAQVQPPPGAAIPAGQKAFADAVNNGGKASAIVGGAKITIDKVVAVQARPAPGAGGDTPRPPPGSTTGGVRAGPAVSIGQVQEELAAQGIADLASRYDLEYVPTIVDSRGDLTYGDAPRTAAGPQLGATGKPVIRFSNLGLQNRDVAVQTFRQERVAEDTADWAMSGGPCGTHSFAVGTRVLMADCTTQPIEDIKVGDRVENAQPGSTTPQQHRVDQTHVTTTDVDFTDVTIMTAGGPRTVTSTQNHPYFDASVDGFVDASTLRVGDRLQSIDGDSAVVSGVRDFTGHVVTYDLTIDGLHTYYAVAGDTPVLVHNTCGPDVPQVLSELANKRVTTGRIFDSSGNAIRNEIEAGGSSDLVEATDTYLRQNGAPINPRATYYPAAQHVESQYAMWMRQNGITDATVVMNNTEGVCGGIYGCQSAITAILPEGSTMIVWYPGAIGPVVIPGGAAAP